MRRPLTPTLSPEVAPWASIEHPLITNLTRVEDELAAGAIVSLNQRHLRILTVMRVA
jgi:hypothetical protein